MEGVGVSVWDFFSIVATYAFIEEFPSMVGSPNSSLPQPFQLVLPSSFFCRFLLELTSYWSHSPNLFMILPVFSEWPRLPASWGRRICAKWRSTTLDWPSTSSVLNTSSYSQPCLPFRVWWVILSVYMCKCWDEIVKVDSENFFAKILLAPENFCYFSVN